MTKKLVVARKLAVAGIAGLMSLCAAAETWTFTSPRAWSRTEKAATLAARADGALELRHSGDKDWTIHGLAPINVKPGDTFRLSCASEALGDIAKPKDYSLDAILWDAKGNVLSWAYGSRSAKPGEPVVTEFMIPPGGARIEPRAEGLQGRVHRKPPAEGLCAASGRHGGDGLPQGRRLGGGRRAVRHGQANGARLGPEDDGCAGRARRDRPVAFGTRDLRDRH